MGRTKVKAYSNHEISRRLDKHETDIESIQSRLIDMKRDNHDSFVNLDVSIKLLTKKLDEAFKIRSVLVLIGSGAGSAIALTLLKFLTKQ